MNYPRLLINVLFLALIPCWGYAQYPNSNHDLVLEDALLDEASNENGSTSLILDNSRTKVGRDFYDLFYKYWTAFPIQADTTQQHNSLLVTPSGDVVILVEEIPAPGTGTTNQILISINDQPVWQQFVQARYDLLETDALYALEIVRQYLADYQEMQQLFGNQGLKGLGVN